MKNVKKGFSLAEALIAIAVIGTIAAITLPTAIDNTRNRKLAAALGRNVEAIETGCRLIVQEASERSREIIDGIWLVNRNISGVAQNDDNRLVINNNNNGGFLSQSTYEFLNTADGRAYTTDIKEINGVNRSAFLSGRQWGFAKSSKLGSYYGYHIKQESMNDSSMDGKNFDQIKDPILGLIYIDVNNSKSPNKFGRDIFLFGLTNSCHMVPAGTVRMRNLTSQNSGHPIGGSIPAETEGCVGDNPQNGLSCTARIVRSGYKMDY